MKVDFLEFFKQLCLSVLFSCLDLIFFDFLLRFTDAENAHLLAGMVLGFIFYNLAVKIGMIKYD